MRLDKYLKLSRIIKRRTIANAACDAGRVSLNGKTAKAGAEVNTGDVVTLNLNNKITSYKIISVKEAVKKNETADMYEVLDVQSN